MSSPTRYRRGLLGRRLKYLLKAFRSALAPSRTSDPVVAAPSRKRFLGDQPQRTVAHSVDAARGYVGKLADWEREYLFQKPFAPPPSYDAYYTEIYPVLNLIKAMDVPSEGRVLEVGCGPGWVTEILRGLGFDVDAIEPSEEMIRIARERIESSARHHHFARPRKVAFHATTLEGCRLADGSVDAILFHASLHHIIDEQKALDQCFRLLKPGGVLGVSEAAWTPGHRATEESFEREMERFGTLENPYTIEYLDHLLSRSGFIDVERYHSFNGLVPVELEGLSLSELLRKAPAIGNVVAPAHLMNNLTARKPSGLADTRDSQAFTFAEIAIVEASLDPVARTIRIKARLANRGESLWLFRPRTAGWVSISLRSGDPLAPDFVEAEPRQLLPARVPPGKEVVVDLLYSLPERYAGRRWFLDLVNEGLFWFSERGTVPAEVEIR